jgi:hypothetical protein
MAEGFLLGPDLLARTRRTIETVEGGVLRSGFHSTQPILEGDVASNPKVFRICTFTGAWSINSTKTVTFKYQTATPNTANVTNLFFPIVGTATSSVDCAIAKDGTAWFLIDVPLATATAVFMASTAAATVVADVVISATLNTANCSITVQRTQTTALFTVVGTTFTSAFVRIGA